MSKNKFNLKDILSSTSKAAAEGGVREPRSTAETRIEQISVFDLVPSEENFYSMGEMEELKTSIELAGRVLQNLVVVPIGDGKYKVLAGHRRRLASLALVEEGKTQYEFLPCAVEPGEDTAEEQEIRNGFLLIVTNSQREKTAWDKLEEARYLREVLKKARTNPKYQKLLRDIVGAVFGDQEVQADGPRDFIAKVLNTSSTQIGRYDAIHRNLCPEFKDELKRDGINLSTAYELSGLAPEEQKAVFEEYRTGGGISIKVARKKKGTSTVKKVVAEKVKPEPTREMKEPVKKEQSAPNQRGDQEEMDWVVTQLEDLRAYCAGMDREQSRDWTLDVDALTAVISRLRIEKS